MNDMGLQSVIVHLFRNIPTGYQPQLALGNRVKQALLWLPGNKPSNRERVEYWLGHPLLGCMGVTNRAYRDPFGLQHEQEPALCWAGLDIDADDNPGVSVSQLAERVRRACPSASIRTSFGGHGLHAFHVFTRPVYLPTCWCNAYTRAFNRLFVEALAEVEVEVCKSDSRVFWVCGGKNTWLHMTDHSVEPLAVPKSIEALTSMLPGSRAANEQTEAGFGAGRGSGEHAVSENVRAWLVRFAQAGIRITPGHQNPVHVGTAIRVIREHGGSVVTKSPCRSKSGINGYLDCAYDRISLWTYADGATVWADIDSDRLIDEMLGDD